MELLVHLEYLIIKPVANNIDFNKHIIIVNHNIDYLLITIEKIQLQMDLPLDLPNIYFKKGISFKQFLEYVYKIKQNIKILDNFIDNQDYLFVPLYITNKKLEIGLLLFNNHILQHLKTKSIPYNITQTFNLLSIINHKNNTSADMNDDLGDDLGDDLDFTIYERYNIIYGILEYINKKDNHLKISNELKKWLINIHNYLPKFKVFRKKKKIINSFQNRLNP
jgi:hypothetical protein